MNAEEVVYEEPGTGIAVREDAAAPATLFRTDDPAEVVERAKQTADALMAAVKAHDARQTDKAKKLISVIQGREFPKVECWTLLGTMLGVFPVCEWTRPVDGGWEARVEARTLGGLVVGAAEAQCLRSESNWKGRDDYALRSMAQTRATSKALSVPLRFVMTLAGLEGTPAEEMPHTPAEPRAAKPQQAPAFRAPASVTVPADAPFGSALQEPPTDGGDPAHVKVHFGKNVGKPLGELAPKSREWYAADGWAEKKTGNVSAEDRRLRMAARMLSGLPVPETEGVFASAGAQSDDESSIPF